MKFVTSPKSKRTYNLKAITGPALVDGLAEATQWAAFKNNIQYDLGLALAELWYEKAVQRGGVPLRQDFSFDELVKYGSNLYLGKLDEDNKWQTTFCGGGIVDNVGFDPTAKSLDEFGSAETLKFWLDNLKIMTDHNKPFLEFYTLEFANKEYKHCTGVNLPLRSEDCEITDVVITHEAFSDESLYPDHLDN